MPPELARSLARDPTTQLSHHLVAEAQAPDDLEREGARRAEEVSRDGVAERLDGIERGARPFTLTVGAHLGDTVEFRQT